MLLDTSSFASLLPVAAALGLAALYFKPLRSNRQQSDEAFVGRAPSMNTIPGAIPETPLESSPPSDKPRSTRSKKKRAKARNKRSEAFSEKERLVEHSSESEAPSITGNNRVKELAPPPPRHPEFDSGANFTISASSLTPQKQDGSWIKVERSKNPAATVIEPPAPSTENPPISSAKREKLPSSTPPAVIDSTSPDERHRPATGLGNDRLSDWSGESLQSGQTRALHAETGTETEGFGGSVSTDDEGFALVRPRRRKQASSGGTGGSGTVLMRATETQTKKQRQNQAKSEALKASKAQEEADRLARLAHHKRDVEMARIEGQYKRKGNAKQSSHASVDDSGHLVWE